MDWFFYGLAFFLAVLFTASAVYALHWSSKHGQLRDFERGAASIFDEKEPVGVETDHFPGRKTNHQVVGQFDSMGREVSPRPPMSGGKAEVSERPPYPKQ